jgi:hypothetical protein
MMFSVVYYLLQNLILNVGELQPNLSFKVSTVLGLFLHTLSSRQQQTKKSGDDKSGDWGATGSLKGLSCSEANTHTVKRVPLSAIC